MTSIDKNLANKLHDLAQKAFAKGESHVARPLWQAAIAKDPSNTDFYVSLAKLETASGNHAESERLWTDAVNLAPTNYELALGLADVLIHRPQGQSGAASGASASAAARPAPALSLDVLQNCSAAQEAFAPEPVATRQEAPKPASASESPSEPAPASKPASAPEPAHTEASEAASPPEHVSAPYGDDPEAKAQRHFDVGKQKLDRNNIPGAIRAFEAAIEADGSNPKYFYKLASVHHRQAKNLDVALPLYRQAINFEPSNPMWHNGLGACLEERGDLRSAFQSYDHALFLKPDSAIYNANRAGVKVKLDAAAAQAEAAQAQAQSARDKARSQSGARAQAGAQPQAKAQSQTYSIADPLAPRAGETPQEVARRKQLNAAYTREATKRASALAAAPHDAGLAFGTAFFYYLFGRFDESRALFARLRDMSPSTPESVRHMVDVLKNNPASNNFFNGVKMARHLDVEEALPYFMAATELEPRNGLYQSFLGLSFLAMGMAHDALEPLGQAFRQVQPLADRQADAFNLSVALESAGYTQAAANHRRESGVPDGVRMAGEDLLKLCLSNDRSDIPSRSEIPNDGLLAGQDVETLIALLASFSDDDNAGEAAGPSHSDYESRQEPPHRQESPYQEAPNARWYTRQEAPPTPEQSGPSAAGAPGHFVELPEHLREGPAYSPEQMTQPTARDNKIVAFFFGAPGVADASSHGMSHEHLQSIKDWFFAEYQRKDSLTLKKVGLQLAPLLAVGLVPGGAIYKKVRIEIQKKRMDAMAEALNRAYQDKGVVFSYVSRGVFVWQPQVGGLNIHLPGRR